MISSPRPLHAPELLAAGPDRMENNSIQMPSLIIVDKIRISVVRTFSSSGNKAKFTSTLTYTVQFLTRFPKRVAMIPSYSFRVISLSVLRSGSNPISLHLSLKVDFAFSLVDASSAIFLRLLDPCFFSRTVTTK